MTDSDLPDREAPGRRRARASQRPLALGGAGVTGDAQGEAPYAVASVEPLDVDGVRTITIGTALWVIAFIGLLPFVGTLRDSGHIWWLWTCLAGFGLGLIGIEYCRRRRQTKGRTPALEAGRRSSRLDS